MEYWNVMEEFVARKLDEVIDSLGCCKCDRCRKDILSFALNRLAPKYVSTDKGKVLANVELTSGQAEIDVLAAIYEGAELVKRNPRHFAQKA